MACGCTGCFWGALAFKKQPVFCFRQKGSAGIYAHAVFRLPSGAERVGGKCPPIWLQFSNLIYLLTEEIFLLHQYFFQNHIIHLDNKQIKRTRHLAIRHGLH